MAQDRNFLSRQKGVGELHASRASHGSHLLHSDKVLPVGLCSKIDPQHSPPGEIQPSHRHAKKSCKKQVQASIKTPYTLPFPHY